MAQPNNFDPRNPKANPSSSIDALIWIATGVIALALLFGRAIYPDTLWLTIVLGVLLVAALGALVWRNARALTGRTAAYGLNSLVTVVLVIAILGVLNFLAEKHPLKADLTKNKVHTLSDQTVKVVKGLQKPVRAVLYGKIAQREQYRPLLENYRSLNPKFEIEYVDPDREPTRFKSANIKKANTLQLLVGARDSKVEEPTEEKVTNALIKLLKDKSPTLCALTGHGEKSFSSKEAEGYDAVKTALGNQSYEVRDLALVQEGKVPDTCDAVAIIGPTKAFFAPEVKALHDYLAAGGRAIVAVDLNLQGADLTPELTAMLEGFNVKPLKGVIVDPLSKMLGVDAAVPILATFNKENAITRDFATNCYFPFTRPLELGKGEPADWPGMKLQWLANTTPRSWAVLDVRELATGQVSFKEGRDKMGPLTVAAALEGKSKESKASRNMRMVVFGTSLFATNNYSRFGGNLDFFVNAVSWVMEDESLISIRAKDETPGRVELTQTSGRVVFLITVLLVPLAIAVAGVVVWALRRRL